MTIPKESNWPMPGENAFSTGPYSSVSFWPETVTETDLKEIRQKQIMNLMNYRWRAFNSEGMPPEMVLPFEVGRNFVDRESIVEEEAVALLESYYGVPRSEALPIVRMLVNNLVKAWNQYEMRQKQKESGNT